MIFPWFSYGFPMVGFPMAKKIVVIPPTSPTDHEGTPAPWWDENSAYCSGIQRVFFVSRNGKVSLRLVNRAWIYNWRIIRARSLRVMRIIIFFNRFDGRNRYWFHMLRTFQIMQQSSFFLGPTIDPISNLRLPEVRSAFGYDPEPTSKFLNDGTELITSQSRVVAWHRMIGLPNPMPCSSRRSITGICGWSSLGIWHAAPTIFLLQLNSN